MDKFLMFSKEDQNITIMNTAKQFNMPEAIIEKDFWVCYMLHYLFTEFKYKDFICFKGGTSLSKVYHSIERFSEDIDLSLDWSIIGVLKEEAYIPRSNRQQDIYNKKMNEKTEIYIEKILLPIIQNDFNNKPIKNFKLYVDETNTHTICFQYPRVYQDSSILQNIRLEFGVLAEPVPSNIKTIKPYLAKRYPHIFIDEIKVKTVDIQRTFFEKITILHREANRLNGNYPRRYSRHYYDTYQMIKNNLAYESLENIELLKMVIDFKKKFYPCNWAKYDEILEGKCHLVPNATAIKTFSQDYDNMKSMFYSYYPPFNEIISVLSQFEKVMNKKLLQETVKI